MARLPRSAVRIQVRMNALAQPLPRKSRALDSALLALAIVLLLIVTQQGVQRFRRADDEVEGEDYRQFLQ